MEFPCSAGSIDFAYSNQLMEHLHPDDAVRSSKSLHGAATRQCLPLHHAKPLVGPFDISSLEGQACQASAERPGRTLDGEVLEGEAGA